MTQRPGPLETNAATRSSRVARSRRRNTSQADTPSPSQAFPSPARRGKCRRRWGPERPFSLPLPGGDQEEVPQGMPAQGLDERS